MPNWWRPTRLPIDPFGTPDTGYGTFRVTSPFGWRDNPLNPGQQVFHGGLDLGNARLGDLEVAVADGKVHKVGTLGLPWSQPTNQWPSGNYGGLMVILDHGTHISLYAHMRSEQVTRGQVVKAGDVIGTVGESGSATGQGHLHFGISDHTAAEIEARGTLLPNAWCVDPWPLIEPNAASTATRPEDDDVLGDKTNFRDNPYRGRVPKGTAIRTDTRISDDTLDFVTETGYEFTVIGNAFGNAYPAGSDNRVWRVFGLDKKGLRCVHDALVQLIPDETDGDCAEEAAAATKSEHDRWTAWLDTAPS